MKESEAERLKSNIAAQILKKGMPINIRKGSEEELADWFGKILDKNIEIDEPLGVVQGNDYEHCPRCNGIVGQSAFYCKKCGSWLREGGIR